MSLGLITSLVTYIASSRQLVKNFKVILKEIRKIQKKLEALDKKISVHSKGRTKRKSNKIASDVLFYFRKTVRKHRIFLNAVYKELNHEIKKVEKIVKEMKTMENQFTRTKNQTNEKTVMSKGLKNVDKVIKITEKIIPTIEAECKINSIFLQWATGQVNSKSYSKNIQEDLKLIKDVLKVTKKLRRKIETKEK